MLCQRQTLLSRTHSGIFFRQCDIVPQKGPASCHMSTRGKVLIRPDCLTLNEALVRLLHPVENEYSLKAGEAVLESASIEPRYPGNSAYDDAKQVGALLI